MPAICISSYEGVLFKPAIRLAFFGFLRVSEFACIKKQTLSKVININNISLQKGQLGVVLRFSKTDQCGQSIKLLIDKSKNVKLCPVKAMSDWARSWARYLSILEGPTNIFSIWAGIKRRN